MKGREPWLGLATIAGLAIMLFAEGPTDAAGLALAALPGVYGVVAWRRARRARATVSERA
jgi:hypothetical protein